MKQLTHLITADFIFYKFEIHLSKSYQKIIFTYKDYFDVVETFKTSFFSFSIVKCEPYGEHLDCQC